MMTLFSKNYTPIWASRRVQQRF